MKRTIFAGALLLLFTLTISKAYPQAPPATAEWFKRDFLSYINTQRQQGCNCGSKWYAPVPPLTWNPLLQKAAYGHARDMNDQKYFNHTSKDGRTMMSRIVFAGYYYNGYKDFAVGENIAWGQQSIKQVMDEWFKSEGHCHNLMNPKFKEVGIAQYNDYWVQDFGGRNPFSLSEQKMLSSGKATVGEMRKNDK